MPYMNRLSNYKTTIANDKTHTVVTYQTTRIVRFNGREIILDSGGWESVTTKRKMNQASNQFDLGYGVMQKNGVWTVRLPNGKTVPFVDGMKFKRIEE